MISLRGIRPGAMQWALLALILVAVLIRGVTIGQGTNVDEGDYLMQGREMALGHWPHKDVHLNKPPLVSLIAYPFFLIWDIPIVPVRILMIGLSVSAIYALYRIGALLFDQQTGVLAATFLALDPFAAIWAKPLHVSSLAPVLAVWALAALLSGLRSGALAWLAASGVFTALALLNKQTGVLLFPTLALAAWYAHAQWKDPPACSFRNRLAWAAGFLPPLLLFGLYLIALNAIEPFWYDVWTGNHRMSAAFDQSAAERWREFFFIAIWNPWAWLLALGGIVWGVFRFNRAAWLLTAWLAIEWGVNLFALSHFWVHYTLVIMPPAFLLSAWLIRQIAGGLQRWAHFLYQREIILGLVVIALLCIPYWGRANWAYPNLTLEEERALASFIERHNDSPYLLCFANSAFYFWTDSLVPPALRDGREVRIPPFMNTAGRGYLDQADMQATANHWRQLDIDFGVMYGKYYRQIFVDRDPLLAPIREWLEEDFTFQQRLNYRPGYMGELYCFEREEGDPSSS